MWAQIINALIGLAIMIAPGVLDFTQQEADVNHVLGPLVIAFAFISLWECNRNVRLINIITGACLIAASIVFSFQTDAFLIDIIGGILLIAFSLIKGKVKQRFGGGWRSLFMKSPPHSQS